MGKQQRNDVRLVKASATGVRGTTIGIEWHCYKKENVVIHWAHTVQRTLSLPPLVMSMVTVISVFGLDTMATTYGCSQQDVLPKCELIAREELGAQR